MKIAGKSNSVQEKPRLLDFSGLISGGKEKLSQLFQPAGPRSLQNRIGALSQRSQHLLDEIKTLGFTRKMDGLERGKLSVFNQLNLFQLLTGILVPLIFLIGPHRLPVTAFFVGILPALVNLVVLCLNFYYRYEAGMISYFVLYPLVTSIVYMYGMNLGVELYFFLNGVLAVFFLPEISQMLFSVGLSMVSYFVLVVINKEYIYQLRTSNFYLYLFNQGTAIVFIFYTLFLIKKENNLYQFGILASNRELQEKNEKIENQKAEIEQKAAELSDLNSLKNKLFSVISHDLKTPMYALRNLFRSMQQLNMSSQEIKDIIPDVVTDLNYTTGLMENLLHWVKSQMQSASFSPIELNMEDVVDEAVHVLHLQANTKKVSIQTETEEVFTVYADRDMVTLVLRNLLSNAIKFTPEKGTIFIRLKNEFPHGRISVIDNGIGMDPETLQKIQANDYYSTQGTAHERGTGLGLMLSRDFLTRNGGVLTIESELGRGSIFSFTLPLAKNIQTA